MLLPRPAQTLQPQPAASADALRQDNGALIRLVALNDTVWQIFLPHRCWNRIKTALQVVLGAPISRVGYLSDTGPGVHPF